jgi:hypothetical protein
VARGGSGLLGDGADVTEDDHDRLHPFAAVQARAVEGGDGLLQPAELVGSHDPGADGGVQQPRVALEHCEQSSGPMPSWARQPPAPRSSRGG